MITYKHLNLFLYRFAQFLLVSGTLAFPFGLIYLIIVSSFDDTFIFDMNTFIFSILYILIPFTTGTLITEKYSSFYSEKHKNNLNDKSLEQKVEK